MEMEVEVSATGEATLSTDPALLEDEAPSPALSASVSLGFTRGDVQILTGDFNAEPMEPAYRFITGQESIVETAIESGGVTQSPDFRDAWLLGGETGEESDGYTFPSCNPVKRIDFLLVRNASNSAASCKDVEHNRPSNSWRAEVMRTWRVGLAPTPETVDRVGVSAADHF